MRRSEHYRQAEKLMKEAGTAMWENPKRANRFIAAAQVHALLTLTPSEVVVAAHAEEAPGPRPAASQEWKDTFSYENARKPRRRRRWLDWGSDENVRKR